MSKKWGYLLTIAFFLLVSYLLYNQLSELKFKDIVDGFSHMSISVIAIGVLLTLFNYFVLTSFDYLGFRRLKLSFMTYKKVIINAFICYAVNLNLGSFIGGIGFRYRLYTKYGVEKEKVPYIVMFSTLANWSGYALLVGLILILQGGVAKKIVKLPEFAVASIGFLALILVLLYFYLCYKEIKIKIKGIFFKFPKLKIAFIQIILATLQWLSLSYIIYHFIRSQNVEVDYLLVLMTYLLASIAAVATHLPAGLGVLETIFLRMDPSISNSKILVALICFRAIYNLGPLAIALPTYLFVELKKKKATNKRDNKAFKEIKA